MIRFFDILFAAIALVLLGPLIILLAVWVAIDSRGGPFYRQWRVGKKGKAFRIWKLRTMYRHADKIKSLTIGDRDNRITRAGLVLRKHKLDELPQLLNVIRGEMSLAGPRPELKKYTDLYNQRQLEILQVKPGITDIASLVFSNENQLLIAVPDPERFYVKTIMPLKIRLNRVYCVNQSLRNYFTILGWSALHLLHIGPARIRRMKMLCTPPYPPQPCRPQKGTGTCVYQTGEQPVH